MSKKQRFFIADRTEFFILFSLGLLIAAGAFTVGVHFAKRAFQSHQVEPIDETQLAKTEDEKVPDRVEIAEQTKGARSAVHETLDKVLHKEVTSTGIRLDVKRQVGMPEDAKHGNSGATTLKNQPTTKQSTANQSTGNRVTREERQEQSVRRDKPRGQFTIQIGSYQTLKEATDKAGHLEKFGIEPFVRPVDLKDKGRWYRVYLGGFESKQEAQASGKRYVDQHAIQSFLVARMPNSG